jgi:hypothetical protein
MPVGQGAQVADANTLGLFANPNGRFGNTFAQLGWTGGDPVIYGQEVYGENGETRQIPIGVTPEFQQFVQANNIQMAMEPLDFGGRMTLSVNNQPVDQYQDRVNSFEKVMNVVAPIGATFVLSMATAGAATAALTAAVPGISTATATAIGRAVAPSIVQAAQTGNFNIEQAARNVVVNLVAPSIGAEAAATVQDTYGQLTGGVLPPAVERAISNAAASAAATAMQQGADSSDIGRNLLAGAVSSAVGTTLNSAGVDASISAGAGRAAGSYISTGSGVQALVDGVTRGLTFEQQRQAVQEERNVRNIERAYQDPSRALDVVSPGSVEQAVSNIESPAAQDLVTSAPTVQQVETVGQAQTGGVTDQDIQAAIQREQATPPAATPAQQIQVTATQPSVRAEETFSSVAAPTPAPAQSPVAAPAATAPVASTTPAAAPAPVQQVTTTGAREQVAEDPFAGVTQPPPAPPGREGEVQAAAPKTGRGVEETPTFTESIPVTGTAEPAMTDEDIFAYLDQLYAPSSPPPAAEPAQQVTTVGQRLPQEVTVTGTPPTAQDLDTGIRSGETGRVDITGQRPAQEITVVGQQPTDEDILSFISEPAAELAPAPSPAPAASSPAATPVYPTDIFTYINRGRQTPMPVARLAAMDYPMSRTMGVSGFVPAGELEPGGSTKPRQSVWNEASLRLKDALGL